MKFKIFSLLVILGIISVMPLIYMGKLDPMAIIETAPRLDIGFKKIQEKVSENISNVVSDEKVQVYKWRDQNGVMQFSSEPPSTTADVERVVLDPDINVIQAVNLPEQDSVEEKKVAITETPNPYSIKGMKKVMDDAKGLEQVLQQRDEEQQKILDGL